MTRIIILPLAVKIAIICAIACMSLTANAMPAWPGWLIHQQSDGTTLTYRLIGDEHVHGFVTTDGYLLANDVSGDLCYATTSQDEALLSTGVVAHEPEKRTATETRLLQSLSKQKTLSVEAIGQRVQSGRSIRKLNVDPALTRGKIKGIVLLVEFADNSFYKDYTQEIFYRKMNEPGFADYGATGSCRDYFIDQSDSLFMPSFDVVGPIKLKKVEAYYGANDGNGQDMNPGAMVQEACTFAHDSLGVDFSKYDNNHDGTVDFVYIIYAGYAESYGASSSTIWPHASELQLLGYNMSFDGVTFNRYACSNELSYTTGHNFEGIGSFCHEFGHVLGLPDLYNTLSSGVNELGDYDIMDRGSYNNSQRTPPAYSAFELSSLNWMGLTELHTASDSVELPELGSSRLAYRIPTATGNSNEYFILENRQQQGWDTYLPGHGLMITHINYDESLWNANLVNASSQPHVDLVEADGTQDGTHETDLYPTSTNNMFTDYSLPSSLAWDGTPTEKGVTNIQENGQLITFKFMRDQLQRPQLAEPTDIKENAFTANWKAVEGAGNYQITVNEVLPDSLNPIVLDEDFSKFTTGDYPKSGYTDISEAMDNYTHTQGWYGNELYEAGGYVRIGSYGKSGKLSSPLLDLSGEGGQATVAFHAVSYPGKKVSYKVQLYDTSLSQVLEEKELKADRNETAVSLNFTKGSARCKVVITTEGERLFLNDLRVLKGTVDADSAWNAGPKSWTARDIADTHYTVTGLAAQRSYIYFVETMPHNGLRGSLPSTPDTVTTTAATYLHNVKTASEDFHPMEENWFRLDGTQVGTPDKTGIYIRRQTDGQGRKRISKQLVKK